MPLLLHTLQNPTMNSWNYQELCCQWRFEHRGSSAIATVAPAVGCCVWIERSFGASVLDTFHVFFIGFVSLLF